MASTERTLGRAPSVAPRVTAEQVAEYQREGLTRIQLPPAIQDLRGQLRDEIADWVRHFAPDFSIQPKSLCQDLARLAQRDRRIVGVLYKVARRFPAVKQMASHDSLVRIACHMMGTTSASCCNFVSVRIDLPDEDKFLVKPHQDFPYIQGSLNGVTIWLPLEECLTAQGPPQWVPGSHDWGVLPVHEYSLDEVGRIGAGIFELAEPERLSGQTFQHSEVGQQEALLFHTLLVHRSAANRSPRARVSLQFRYDDLFDQQSFVRDYPEGRYLDHRLKASYPEYCLPHRKTS